MPLSLGCHHSRITTATSSCLFLTKKQSCKDLVNRFVQMEKPPFNFVFDLENFSIHRSIFLWLSACLECIASRVIQGMQWNGSLSPKKKEIRSQPVSNFDSNSCCSKISIFSRERFSIRNSALFNFILDKCHLRHLSLKRTYGVVH